MHIRMLPAETAPAGWVAKLVVRHCQVTHGFAPFGGTDWVVKRDGSAVILRQAKDRVANTRLDNPTPKQLALLRDIESTGVAKLFGVPQEQGAAHV